MPEHSAGGIIAVALVRDAFRHMRLPHALAAIPALVALATEARVAEGAEPGRQVQVLLRRAIDAVGMSSLSILDHGPAYFRAILIEVYAEGMLQKEVLLRHGVRSDATFSTHLRRACEEAARYLQRLQAGDDIEAGLPEYPGGVDAVGRRVPPPLELPLTSFVDRERELAILARYFEGAGVTRGRPPCLITLTGPPGVGKSRLAAEAADAARPRFEGGVWWVSLAMVPDATLAPAAIAKALQIGNDPLPITVDRLALTIGDGKVLLVLDDFDHVRPALPAVLQLLQRCRRLVVLVTGREALRTEGEHLLDLAPLPVPPAPTGGADDAADGAPADDPGDQPAMRLFFDRARAADGHYVATPSERRDVATLCRRLDGLPLAIELVAAGRRGLSLAPLLRGEDRVLALRSPHQTMPPWHVTLHDAISWSYETLAPDAQRLFRRCAIFGGSFSRTAVEQVCLDAEEERPSLPALLGALVAKHLLQAQHDETGAIRYAFLTTIRRYAWERLSEHRVALRATRTRHTAIFLDLVRRSSTAIFGPEQVPVLAALERDVDNLRAVLQRSLNAGAALTGLGLATDLWLFWFLRGHAYEGKQWLARFLELTAQPTEHAPNAIRAKALFVTGFLTTLDDPSAAEGFFARAERYWQALGGWQGQGWCLLGLGQAALARSDHLAAGSRLLEALQCFESPKTAAARAGAGWALSNLGYLAHVRGDNPTARQYLERARFLWENLGDAWGRAVVLSYLANQNYVEGFLEEAEVLYQQSVQLFRDLGFRAALAWRLNALGDVQRLLGQSADAAAAYSESRRLFEDQHVPDGVAWSLHNLAYLALRSADFPGATDLLTRSLTTFRILGHRAGITACLVALAAVGAGTGDVSRVATLLGAVEAALATGIPLEPADRAEYDRIVQTVRERLGDDGWTVALQAGMLASLDDAVNLALGAGGMP